MKYGPRKKRKRMRATVTNVIPSHHSEDAEKAQIEIHDGEPLYREIRVENELTDDNGGKARLKPGTEVDVVIEAPQDATTTKPKHTH